MLFSQGEAFFEEEAGGLPGGGNIGGKGKGKPGGGEGGGEGGVKPGTGGKGNNGDGADGGGCKGLGMSGVGLGGWNGLGISGGDGGCNGLGIRGGGWSGLGTNGGGWSGLGIIGGKRRLSGLATFWSEDWALILFEDLVGLDSLVFDFGGSPGIGTPGRGGNGIGGSCGNGGSPGNGGREGRKGTPPPPGVFGSWSGGGNDEVFTERSPLVFWILGFWLQRFGCLRGLNEKNPAENMCSPCFLDFRRSEEEVAAEATAQ